MSSERLEIAIAFLTVLESALPLKHECSVRNKTRAISIVRSYSFIRKKWSIDSDEETEVEIFILSLEQHRL